MINISLGQLTELEKIIQVLEHTYPTRDHI
jgi:hypothetical protein